MRVLATSDTSGGVFTYFCELARTLAPAGVEFVLATKGAALSRTQKRELSRLENVRASESSFRLEWQEEPWDDVSLASEWLRELAQDTKPDVVHLNDYAHATVDFGAPKLLVAHSCVVSWHHAVKHVPPGAEWDRYRAVVKRGIAAADALVAPSQAMLASTLTNYGRHPNAHVIHDARDPRLFVKGDKASLVLAAGRLRDEAKNLPLLARVARDLPWPVAFAGDELAPDGGALDFPAVRFLGKLAPIELACWLGHASIYALPARYEPFGMSVLEAALSSCALVLGDIPSLRESWDDAAVFVDPDDASGLRRAILELIEDRRKREDLGRRARSRAGRFKPEKMGRAYLELYHDLAARRRLRRAS